MARKFLFLASSNRGSYAHRTGPPPVTVHHRWVRALSRGDRGGGCFFLFDFFPRKTRDPDWAQFCDVRNCDGFVVTDDHTNAYKVGGGDAMPCTLSLSPPNPPALNPDDISYPTFPSIPRHQQQHRQAAEQARNRDELTNHIRATSQNKRCFSKETLKKRKTKNTPLYLLTLCLSHDAAHRLLHVRSWRD